MSLLLKGITKISELEIDADKDWDGKGISNIKEIAEAMAIGHIAQYNGTRLLKLPPGPENYVLTSQGLAHLVVWTEGGAYFHRFFPVTIDLSHAEAIVTPDHTHQETPSITAAPYSWKKVVDGGVADDGGAQTDETAAAQNDTIDDITLLPVCTDGGLAVGDAYYFGFAYLWDLLWLNVSTAGVGNYALAYEYWDGDSWELLGDLIDDTSEFTVAGLNKIAFTRPVDWALTIIQGMNLYWMRARVTDVVTYTAQPLGAQAWCEVYF